MTALLGVAAFKGMDPRNSIGSDRDVERVQQIDGESRHQPDRAGAGHDHDVAHNIAGNEACFTGRLQMSHPYALELRTISPGRDDKIVS